MGKPNNLRTVIFVPAKGSSDRIANKNLAILDGEFLFKHKLRQLLDCALIDEVVLDTDSDQIANFAGKVSILLEPDSSRQPIEFGDYLADRMCAANIEPKIYCPHKGDILIWHGNLAHEGTRILDESRTRRSYITHYTSLKAYPPGHMKPNALINGRLSNENGGYVFEYPWLRNPKLLLSARMFAKTKGL